MEPILKIIIIMAIGAPIAMVTFIGIIGFIVYCVYPIFDKLMNKANEEAKYLSNPFWPSLGTVESTKIVARNASEIMFLLAGVNATFAVFNIFGTELIALIDSAILIIIGFFVRKMSRIAAIIGFLFYITVQIIAFIHFPRIFNTVGLLLFFLALVNRIRATFKHHILCKNHKGVCP